MRTRELAREFLEFRRYMVVSDATVEAYEWALGRLAKDVPELPCTEDELLKALNPPGLALDSRRSLRRMANTFSAGWNRERVFRTSAVTYRVRWGRKWSGVSSRRRSWTC